MENPANGILNVIFFVDVHFKIIRYVSVHTDINIKAVCVLKLYIHSLVSFFRNIVWAVLYVILVGITLQILLHARYTSVKAICELYQCTMHIVVSKLLLQLKLHTTLP